MVRCARRARDRDRRVSRCSAVSNARRRILRVLSMTRRASLCSGVSDARRCLVRALRVKRRASLCSGVSDARRCRLRALFSCRSLASWSAVGARFRSPITPRQPWLLVHIVFFLHRILTTCLLRTIFRRFYGIPCACVDSGSQAPRKRPGYEASVPQQQNGCAGAAT